MSGNARATSSTRVASARQHSFTYGSDDSWAPVEAAATAFGIEPEILPEHDHSGAIRDVDGVLRFVLEFLYAVYPVHSEKSMTDAPLGEPEGA
jgi:hypothetical protein